MRRFPQCAFVRDLPMMSVDDFDRSVPIHRGERVEDAEVGPDTGDVAAHGTMALTGAA